MEAETVPCPVCNGVGYIYPQKPKGCLCCGGVGYISKKRSEVLAKIRADLTKRCQEKGIIP